MTATLQAKPPSALPRPRGHRLSGTLGAFEADRLGFLLRVHADHGALAAFDGRTTIVSSATLTREVLRGSASFVIPRNFLGRPLDDTERAAVEHARPLLNPGLRRHVITELQHDVAARTARTFRTGGVDPLARAEEVLAGSFARHLWGEETAAVVVPLVAGLLDALEVVLGNVFALPPTWPTPAQRRIARRHGALRSTVVALLRDGSATGAAGWAHDVHRRAGSRSPRGPHPAPSPERQADLLIGAMLAAQRVPAAAAGWVLALVAADPALQVRLRSESARLQHDLDAGSAQPVSAYPLALAATCEALRLHPPTWLMARLLRRPVELGGYAFPAGHTLLLSPYVLHRDPEQFEDPERPRPERWLGPAAAPAGYLPFGTGLHRCPGADHTLAGLVTLLLTVVHRHDLRIETPPRADPRLTLRPDGLRLRLVARPVAAAQAVAERPRGLLPA